MSWVMYAGAGGNCERHGETSVVHGGGNPCDESGGRAEGETGVEVARPLESEDA